MKNLILIGFMVVATAASAQFSVDFQTGTSKQDYGNYTLRASYQLTEKGIVALEMRNSDYRYRFIDARQVERGYASLLSISYAHKLYDSDFLRLDGFVKPGLRYVNFNEDDPQPIDNYAFDDSYGVTLQPGIIVSIKATEKLQLHTGANLMMAFQVSPEPLFEQFPSSLILAGFNRSLGEKWMLFSNNMFGPKSGASGDSEKFYWETNIGIRFNFGKPQFITAY